MKICVFGAASSSIDPTYIERVEELGEVMAKRGHSLVFGGGANGLMGAAARGVRANGGHILGVIPKFFEDEAVEALFHDCDELIEPDTMRERKQIMEDECEAFIIVPGGIGTLEEFFQVLTLKQLGRHNKAIAIYNAEGYYNGLNEFFQSAVDKKFIREECKKLYKSFDDASQLVKYIENYSSEDIEWSILKKN